MVTFALIFFVIIALAVLISVTNSFRDAEEDRHHRSNYGNPHNQYPDQHRYDDRHGNYGYNPPIIIQTGPYDPYGGSHRRGDYEPRSSFPLGLLIIVAVAFFWFYSGDGELDTRTGKPEIDTPKTEQPKQTGNTLKILEQQNFEPKEPKINAQPADVNGIEAPVAKWYTLVSRYNTERPAQIAMDKVAETIELQGKDVYYGRSPYGGWVVYIPADSEIQALRFIQQILDHQEELQAYCPDTPKVISD